MADKPTTIKVSGFADEIDPMLDAQLATVTELGMDHISLRSADKISVADFDEATFASDIWPRLQAAGVKISSMGSPIGKIPVDSEEDYQRQLGQLENICKNCITSGCQYIRIFSFFIPEGKNADDYEDVVVEKMKGFVAIAEKYGVTLLHENEKDIYGDICRRCVKLFERVQSPNLKAAFDFANFVQCGEPDIRDCWDAMREHVVYIHIKDAVYGNNENVVFGTGNGHGEEILRKAIVDEGYRGFLTLEPHLVLFDSLGVLEKADAKHVISENKAENGAAGYKMQYEALLGILECIGLKKVGAGEFAL